MFRPVEKPSVMAVGLSLELYRTALPGYMERWAAQFARFTDALQPVVGRIEQRICSRGEQVAEAVACAETGGFDAVLIVPLSYTASGMSLRPLLECRLPLVVWNTQEAASIAEDYTFDTLLMNHVTQGTQDVTNALLRSGRRFGMESGHYRDADAVARLGEWLAAARVERFARTMRVGLLGRAFQDMGDVAVDETRMAAAWGPHVIRLGTARIRQIVRECASEDVGEIMDADTATYDVAPDLSDHVHAESVRLELGLRRILQEERLDALTFNFMDIVDDRRFETLPFFGINKLMGEGLGYAGEGDVVTAAHMAQMRQLCGAANFTEIFTVDYEQRRLLMMHMQECNPALARRDARIRLVRKEFWAPGIEPYVGMVFTLEPGPVTLTCITADEGGDQYYIACETQILDRPPLANLDIPHWMVQLDEPTGEFLTRYSMAGGTHHLVAAPGHHASAIAKLAHLQGLDFVQI